MSKLGVFLSGSQIETSVKTLLETWMHTYLGHVEGDLGYPVYPASGHIPRPKSYAKTAGNALALHDRQLPRIVIQSPGWATAPQHDGQFVLATWAVSILGYWKGHNSVETQDHVRDAATAVMLIMEQKVPSVADSSQVLDVNYDSVPVEREHTMAGFEVVCTVTASGVADRFGGVDIVAPDPPPADEPDPPTDFGDWVTVTSTETTVQNTPTEEVGP